MVKVFICIPTLVNAGAERFVTELASKIDKREVDVSVVVTNHLDKNTAFYNQLNKVGIDVFDVSDKSYFKEFVKIRDLLKEHKPEIVHTNVGSSLHMLIPTWMQGRKVKHIFTAHSMGYRIFSGFKKKIMQIAFKTRMVIPVAICDTVKKSICESYNLAESMVPCVYNGVDTTKFAPKEQYCADGITRFVSVGTLYELKNHSMLIEAFNIVRKKCDNVKLTIVGGGVLYDDLMQQIKNLNLENDVALVGDQSDVGRFLYSSDVYCCPSKVEGLPITVLEAMSTGLPVITTPAGGVVDIVVEDKNGFVVPHGDIEAMAAKMIEFAEYNEMTKRMGRLSREESLKYDIRLCARGYEELYSYVLNN